MATKYEVYIRIGGEVASQFVNSFKKASSNIHVALGDIPALSQGVAKTENLLSL